ncbi:MAG TPA: hypothetical protein VGV63_06575 [Acidimicrobiales bacterium]|nr:hypothetical protein [Acidimicrobiales bacterium]
MADRVAPGVARRSSADVEQVRTVIGGLFLVLSTLYLVKAIRQFLERSHRRT